MKYLLLVGFLGVASASCSNENDCLNKCYANNDADACQKLCDGTYGTVDTYACDTIIYIKCDNGNTTACNVACSHGATNYCPYGCTDLTTCTELCDADHADACEVSCFGGTVSSCVPDQESADQESACLTGDVNACDASCNAGNSDSCKMEECLEARATGDNSLCNYHCAQGLNATCPVECDDVATCSALCLTGDVNACDVGCQGDDTTSCKMKECLEGRAAGDEIYCNDHCAQGLTAACPEGCDDVATCSEICLTGDVNACDVGCRLLNSDANSDSCEMKECFLGDITLCNKHCEGGVSAACSHGCTDATTCSALCLTGNVNACGLGCEDGNADSCNMEECLNGVPNKCGPLCLQGLSAACPEGCTDVNTCSALCDSGDADVCGLLCSDDNRYCKMRDCLGGDDDGCLLACLGGVPNACPEGCTDATTCSSACSDGNNDACIVACHYGNADSCDAAVLRRLQWQVDLGEDADTLNSLGGCIRGNQDKCKQACFHTPIHYFDDYSQISFSRGCSEEFQYCCKFECVRSVYNNRLDGTPTNTASCKLACKAGDTISCLECLDDAECAGGCTHLTDMYKGSCGCEE